VLHYARPMPAMSNRRKWERRRFKQLELWQDASLEGRDGAIEIGGSDSGKNGVRNSDPGDAIDQE